MNEPLYQIAHWDEHFETSETRKLKSLSWVPTPDKHDGLGFRRLAAEKDACELFGAWNLILQIASRGRPGSRGRLARDGVGLSAADLALMTGFPERIFTRALEFFSHPRQGWLVVVPAGTRNAEPESKNNVSPGTPAAAPGAPAASPGTPAARPVEGMEGRESRGGESPPVPAQPRPPRPQPLHPSRPPLRFEPVKRGLYPREYQAMLDHALEQVRRIKEADSSYERELTRESAELVAYIRSQPNRPPEHVQQVLERKDSWKRLSMKPAAAVELAAWKQRCTEIRSAMNGVTMVE